MEGQRLTPRVAAARARGHWQLQRAAPRAPSRTCASLAPSGVKRSSSLPAPGMRRSVARYWSPYACLRAGSSRACRTCCPACATPQANGCRLPALLCAGTLRATGWGHQRSAAQPDTGGAASPLRPPPADHDGLRPAGHQARDVADHNRLPEHGAVEDVADGAVGALPHLGAAARGASAAAGMGALRKPAAHGHTLARGSGHAGAARWERLCCAPHLLEAKLLDARLVGRDGCALDADAALLQRRRGGEGRQSASATSAPLRAPDCGRLAPLPLRKLPRSRTCGCHAPPHQDGLGRVDRDLVVGLVAARGGKGHAARAPSAHAPVMFRPWG